ncbi:STE24 endopeptidase [Fistulifera solaris]|uniref:CAAX prenyl protease n=1 Tax=Fistulifera solaris TaxID=1519565 RepID=A0A1Z5JTS0_FISSO|nr:STE24 endopeptidase [Fistulifera solaris]|eukprot:GAX17410.1 STE24 endopeptidase [Fistulifera solaris]
MSFASLPWTPYYQQEGSTDANDASSRMAQYALAGTILFTAVVYTWESYLDARQHAAYKINQFPSLLETTVSKIDNKEKKLLPQMKEKFSKAQLYGRDKMQLGRIASLYDVSESIAFLLLGFLPYMWDRAAAIGNQYLGYTAEDEIKITLIFLGLVTLIGTVTKLPFELYSTFQVERKHGFNKQTLSLFFTDQIKSLVLTALIGGPFVALLLTIIQKGGEYFYLYVWAFVCVFSLFMMTIVPVVIMPLFNKYEPLPDGDLKDQIYALAKRLNYPLTKLFVMDGSKRSSHSNAFMFGFGNNKRIVLFDTLLTQVEQDEILAILGHELGHWKLGHTVSNLVITQLYVGAAFFVFSQTYGNTELYQAFGFHGKVPTIIALLLFFQTLWAPVDKVLSFLLTLFSRHNEFGADKFGADLGMASQLQTGLIKIHLENLGAMTPDPWYSTYHYSHPPLVERLSALTNLGKKSS